MPSDDISSEANVAPFTIPEYADHMSEIIRSRYQSNSLFFLELNGVHSGSSEETTISFINRMVIKKLS